MSHPFRRLPLPAIHAAERSHLDTAAVLRRCDLQADLLLSCGYTLQAERLAHLAEERRAAAAEKST